jgi:hypothetical protein
MHCDSPDGPTIDQSGREVAPASPSVPQAGNSEPMMSGISGPTCEDSSKSVDLQLCLESRLVANLDVNGSPEYVLTWKQWDMPSGPPICRLAASARPIGDSGYSGWHTPDTGPDAPNLGSNCNGTIAGLGNQVKGALILNGWGTPSARDAKDAGPALEENNDLVPTDGRLPRQVLGATSTSSPAATESRGVLNPEFSRWLMGFPREWDVFAASVTRSFHRLRRYSSGRSSKRRR